MRITGVGVNRAMKNLMAMKAAKEERQDKKEAVIMEIFAKYGRGGLKSLFPSEDVSQPSQDIYKAPGVDSLEITQRELDEVPDEIVAFSQTAKEINAMKSLTKPVNDGGYGLGIETVTSFKANGDPDVFQRLLKKVKKEEEKFSKIGQSLPTDYLQGVVDKAVMTNSTPSGKINIGKIEKYIGREMDDLYKQLLLQEETARGSILLGDVFYAERPDLSQLSDIEQFALSGSLSRAEAEKQKLAKEMSKLADTEGARDLKVWMTDRTVRINEALDKYKDGNIFSAASLYGVESLERILQNFGEFEQVRDALNPALFAEKERVKVPNRIVAEQLYNLGLLESGDVVLNETTNKLIRIE